LAPDEPVSKQKYQNNPQLCVGAVGVLPAADVDIQTITQAAQLAALVRSIVECHPGGFIPSMGADIFDDGA
jgi:hypothetical protein